MMNEEQIEKPRLNWRPFGKHESGRRPDFFATLSGVGYGRVHRIAAGHDAGRWQWTASSWEMKEVSGVADGSRAAALAAEQVLVLIATSSAEPAKDARRAQPHGPAQNVALATGVSPTSEA